MLFGFHLGCNAHRWSMSVGFYGCTRDKPGGRTAIYGGAADTSEDTHAYARTHAHILLMALLGAMRRGLEATLTMIVAASYGTSNSQRSFSKRRKRQVSPMWVVVEARY